MMISAIRSQAPLVLAASTGIAGSIAGFVWRQGAGVPELFKKSIADQFADNPCVVGMNIQSFKWVPLNIVNTCMQTFAKQPHWRFVALGAILGVGILGRGNFKGQEKRHAATLAITALVLPLIAAATFSYQTSWQTAIGLPSNFDASGHIAVMSSVGLAFGLMDQAVQALNANWKARTVSVLSTSLYALALPVMLFNTAGCFHTVDEVALGLAWYLGLALAVKPVAWLTPIM